MAAQHHPPTADAEEGGIKLESDNSEAQTTCWCRNVQPSLFDDGTEKVEDQFPPLMLSEILDVEPRAITLHVSARSLVSSTSSYYNVHEACPCRLLQSKKCRRLKWRLYEAM